MIQKIKEYVKANKYLLMLFLFSTAYFLYQKSMGNSWDFNAFVLNAEYLFGDGLYFETLRPPLMPVIIGLISLLTTTLVAEYIYIILVAVLFFISSVYLAKALGFNEVIYYGLSLNIFVLTWGLVNGTELLSYSLMQLMILFLVKERITGGFFLGLASLARYSNLIFFPFLLLQKNIKKIVLSLFLFGLTLIPWLTYNFIKTGNFLTSIADQYANNILFRQSFLNNSYDNYLIDFLSVTNFLLIPALIGIGGFLFLIYNYLIFNKNKSVRNIWDFIIKNKVSLVMLIILIYTTYSYLGIPLKHARYLFLNLLPLTYFAYKGLEIVSNFFKTKKYSFKKIMTYLFLIILLLNVTSLVYLESSNTIYYESILGYEYMRDKVEELGISDCELMSNVWVPLNYLGLSSQPFPRDFQINSKLDEGYNLLIVHSVGDPEYSSDKDFLESFPILYQAPHYIILGTDNCKERYVYDITYTEEIKNIYLERENIELNINPCFLMFRNYGLLEKTCNFFNMKGFEKDENREIL